MGETGFSRVWMVFFLMRPSSANCQTYYSKPGPFIQVQNLEGINASVFDCPTWYFYNQNSGKCECYKSTGNDDVISAEIMVSQYCSMASA